jgi:hypothetical protein
MGINGPRVKHRAELNQRSEVLSRAKLKEVEEANRRGRANGTGGRDIHWTIS